MSAYGVLRLSNDMYFDGCCCHYSECKEKSNATVINRSTVSSMMWDCYRMESESDYFVIKIDKRDD